MERLLGKPLKADYGDATPVQVAQALLRYRPVRPEKREKAAPPPRKDKEGVSR